MAGEILVDETLPGVNGDTRVILAALQTQVRTLDGAYSDLRLGVSALDHKLDSGLSTLTNNLNTAIGTISSKLEERNRPQWHAMGVMLAAAVAIGGLTYWPIREGLDINRQRISEIEHEERQVATALPEHYVNMREHDRLLRQVDVDFNVIRKELVSRSEHEQHWSGTTERLAELQRQITAIKADFGAVWTSRDELQRLQRELDSLRHGRAPERS